MVTSGGRSARQGLSLRFARQPMKLSNLVVADRAVSEVVAVTVVLAAVVGSFVLGLGSRVDQRNSPNVTFDISRTDLPDTQPNNTTITHTAGDDIQTERLTVTGDVVTDGGQVSNLESTGLADGTMSAGDSVEVGPSEDSGTIRVVWTSTEGESSATLETFEYE